MAKEKSQREKSMLLALLLFLGAGALIFAYLGEGESKSHGPAAVTKTNKYEQSVNRHLMLTNERMELEKQRMAAENARLMDKAVSGTQAQKAYQNDDRLDLSSDTRAAEVAKEIGRGPKEAEISSPHDIVQQELYNEELSRHESQAYREQYARQFIENARRGGYDVKLSPDLTKVISVRPLRNPSNEFDVQNGAPGAAQ